MKGVAGLRVLRLANPFVRAVLESRAHRLLSGRLVVVVYRGHRSGREFRIPVRFAESGAGALVAIAVPAGRKRWWRSFRTMHEATVTLRGVRTAAVGQLAEGEARDAALRAYLDRYPGSARLAGDAAVVVFEVRHG